MISVVLYGRNDSYGYNLHKRAALSFNCIAELLTDPDDEILFVDYNTPDDFPTFPEAIQDTLTAKAQARLRILRVRPEVHARFKDRTHLQALEPVARNVAVRRSNPANRWILSTNTDMIFVPRDGQMLTEQVRNLPKGYYGIPRFEIPESLWETLDRLDPIGTIKTVGDWGWRFHLNEIVYGAPIIKFDAPGDFQLIDRADLIDMHGFDEDMLLGWHVDSNICKRLYLKYGAVGDLSGKLFGYHCDHTRQVTPMHKRTAVENSLARFVDGVTLLDLQKQADSWGCANVDIEEIRLDDAPSRRYVAALNGAIIKPMSTPKEVAYVSAAYDLVDYDPDHVLPYLVDVITSAPRHWNVAWFGANNEMKDLFRRAWPAMGFTGEIMTPVCGEAYVSDANVDIDDVCRRADVFIFDFAAPGGARLGDGVCNADDDVIKSLLQGFYSVLAVEEDRISSGIQSPRRIIAINAIHNRFEPLARGYIEYARSPFSGRLRHGYVLRPERVTPWLDQMIIKRAGVRTGREVVVNQFSRGPVLSGPFLSLAPGKYCVLLNFKLAWPTKVDGWWALGRACLRGFLSSRNVTLADTDPAKTAGEKWRKSSAITVEIMNGERILRRARLSPMALWRTKKHDFRFGLSVEDATGTHPIAVRVRLWASGDVGLAVKSVDLIRIE